MEKVYIAGAVRTPVGSFGGALKDISAVDLGALVINEALKRAGVEKDRVDEVIMGNVLQAGLGQNPCRQAAVKAGIPVTVPSFTVNKLCASGLKSVNLAAQSIMLGHADLIVAGGMESMSRAPYLVPSARWGVRRGHTAMEDSMILDGLWCAFEDTHMGITAENIAGEFAISREEQDRFALESNRKAVESIDSGRFAGEIVAVNLPRTKGEAVPVDTDEHPRRGITLEALWAMAPAFKEGGTVTAGNASGINDGAAAVVLASGKKVRELQLRPLAEILSFASAGVEPRIMGTGPVAATRRLLAQTGLRVEDIGLFELNEAFASQAICCLRELNCNPEITNVNGGAVALGHPIGASGTRVLVTLVYEMMRRGTGLGLASLCVGGGQGISTLLGKGDG